MKMLCLFALTPLGAAPALRAQTAGILPRSGAWGVEATSLNGNGASLLKFTSPSTAWVAGLQFSHGHADQTIGTFDSPSNDNSQMTGQLGHRWYASNGADAHLRTTYGLGVMGGWNHASQGDVATSRGWQAGGCGELGLTWFFTPHFSLGGLSNLSITGGRSTQSSILVVQPGQQVTTTSRISSWSANFQLVRLMGAVYF